MTATAEQQKIADKTLTLVMNQINGVKGNKKPKAIKIGYLGEMKALNIPVTSSGSLALDMAMGVGGYPRGRIIEIYGGESAGKSSLCLHAIAEAQKTGNICAYLDMEHTLDPEYAKALGVNISKLIFSQPDDGDEAMRIVDTLTRSGQVSIIVVDSVASLVTAAEMEGEITDNHMGRQARLMSQALKRLTVLCGKTNTTIIFTNQIRMKIGCVGPETQVIWRLTNEVD
jgi:recombination protein RecA